MSETKKSIPKFKKKLQGFLSDENGKITKEDVLKMGMLAMGIAGALSAEQAIAWHSNTSSHANGGTQAWSYTAISNGNISGWAWYSAGSATCNINTVVNGHFNNAAYPGTIAWGGITWVSVTSHSSHSNSGSWSWTWSGGWC